MQCTHKYTSTAHQLPLLIQKSNCSFEAIRLQWEEIAPQPKIQPHAKQQVLAYETSKIGCLNEYCCDALLQVVKTKAENLVFYGVMASIIGVANYCLMVVLITYKQAYQRRRLDHSSWERYFLIAIYTVVSAGIVYLMMYQPKAPSYMPNVSFKEA